MTGQVGGAATNASGPDGLARVVRGFGTLAASQFASQLIAFVALAYVARRTGATNLGAYAFALALATYFNLLSSLGIDYLAMRDVAQNRESLGSIVGETLLLQGLLSMILYIALVALSPLLATNHEVQRLVPIVGLILLTSTFTLDWALFAIARPGRVAAWRLIGQIVYAALVPVFVVGGERGVFHYAWLNIVGLSVTGIGLLWAFFHVTTARLHIGSPRALFHRLRRSVPFGYSLIMIQIYGGVATIMLGYLASTHAVGIYSIASKLPLALVALANVWLNVFFPHTAQRLQTDPSDFAYDLGRVVTATIVISMAIVVGAFLCAGTLITAMFGESFSAAAEPFALLSTAAALVLVQANFSNVLLAGGSQRYYAITMSVAATTIVVLNFALIPLLGAVGAALSTVLAEIGLTTLTILGVRRRLGSISLDADRLIRGTTAVAAMGLAMYASRSVGGAAIQVAVALPTFVIAAWALRVFDIALIRHTEHTSELPNEL